MTKSSHDVGIVLSEGGRCSSDALRVWKGELVLSLRSCPIVYKAEDRAVEETREIGYTTVGNRGAAFQTTCISVRARSSKCPKFPAKSSAPAIRLSSNLADLKSKSSHQEI